MRASRSFSFVSLWLLWLAGLFAVPAMGQQPTNIRPALYAEHQAVPPGGATTVALEMTPGPGWHGYWKNGGDAGFGMSVEWDLPDGVSVAALDYPVPEPLVLFGLMNYVYEQPYALLARVAVSDNVAPGTDLAISGVARWLACTDKICVPESAIVSVAMQAGDRRAGPTATRFDGWRAALPPVLDRGGTWQRVGDRLRFAIPLPRAMAVTDPYLYVATRNLVDYPAPQRFTRSGDWLIGETRAKGDASGTVDALVRLADGRGLEVRLDPGDVPAAPASQSVGGFDSALFGWALGGAVLGGLLLNLMPCVFPILSLKALSLARIGGDARTAKVEALAYLAGAVTVALALGGVLLALRAGGAEIGWAFQLQNPVSVFLLLLLTIAITANLLGLYELPGFGGGQAAVSAGGARGGFATGALAAFVATPCSGPFMGAALGATLALPAWAALPIFGGLGLGLALPFVTIAYSPALRARLPRPGRWMATFRKWMALPMALTALALAWLLLQQTGDGNAIRVIVVALTAVWLAEVAGKYQRGEAQLGRLLAITFFALVSLSFYASKMADSNGEVFARPIANAYSASALTNARAAGKPVFLNFTADWCITCKVNEQTSITRTEVQAAFDAAGVVQLTGDWTRGDPVITRALADQGRNSLPLYLWYAPGAASPEVLPQILTPAMLIERAQPK